MSTNRDKIENKTRYEFSSEECQRIVDFGRDAVDTFTLEGQMMDVGSVEDLLNMKGGILAIAESTSGLERIRGNAAILEPQRIAESTIKCFVRCCSERSIGSKIRKSELDSIVFSIALVEDIIITDNPKKEIDLGSDVYYIDNKNGGWIYPTKPVKHNWSIEEYIERTHSKSNVKRDEQTKSIILKTKCYREKRPYGNIEKII